MPLVARSRNPGEIRRKTLWRNVRPGRALARSLLVPAAREEHVMKLRADVDEDIAFRILHVEQIRSRDGNVLGGPLGHDQFGGFGRRDHFRARWSLLPGVSR